MRIRARRRARRTGHLTLRESFGFVLQEGIDVTVLVGKVTPKGQVRTLTGNLLKDVTDSLVCLIDVCAEEAL